MESINRFITKMWDIFVEQKLWYNLGEGIVRIIIIVLIAGVTVRIGKNLIGRLFHKKRHGPFQISERREETLRKLTQNILAYIIYFTAFTMVLSVLSIEIGPLLASAGIAGLAIGFGAQDLVKDVISGFFIIFEDQFGVGDYVAFSEIEGTVEEVGLRTTKVKSWTGEQQVVPNGNITQVTNYSVHNGLAIVDINIPYENDIDKAEKIIEDILAELPAKYEQIVSVPVIHGVQNLELSHVVIRVIAETLPVYQWYGARAIRKEVKERLYKEGIDIPSPRLVMYSKNEQPTKLEINEGRE